MLAYFLICLFIFQLYYYIITRHIRDWNSLEDITTSSDSFHLNLSILIPARNEEENISKCLDSVLSNHYPKDKYQIIIIDDHSEDNTVDICQEYAAQYDNIKILSLPTNQIGKKNALKYGSESATGEIICTIDADSSISHEHLSTTSSYFINPEKMILTGPVQFSHDNSFTKMVAMELAGLMVITGAGYVNKWHHLANGTNMAFRREQFNILCGYGGSESFASGDDMFLMNKYKTRFPMSTGFLKSPNTIVVTKSPQNIREFFRQRQRWSTKNKNFPDRGMKAVLTLMFLSSFLIPLNLIFSIWGGFVFMLLAIIGFLIKSVADYRLISTGALFFEIIGWRKIFVPSEIFQIFYVIIIGTSSLFSSKYKWKGRSVE